MCIVPLRHSQHCLCNSCEATSLFAGQGYQLGWWFGKLANQRVPQNREEAVQAAKDVVDTTTGAIRGAVAGIALHMSVQMVLSSSP